MAAPAPDVPVVPAQLSRDILPTVFSYVDAHSLLRSRSVSRHWYNVAGRGCASFQVVAASGVNSSSRAVGIGSVTLVGHRGKNSGPRDLKGEVAAAATIQQQPTSSSLKRTRGHLPEPKCQLSFPNDCKQTSVTVKQDSVSNRTFSSRNPWHAVRIEDATGAAKSTNRTKTDQMLFLSLCLPTSSCELSWWTCTGQTMRGGIPTFGPRIFDRTVGSCSKQFRRILREADLSGLDNLQQLSVRGCGALKVLRLPASLVALDASGCSNLETLVQSFHVGDPAEQHESRLLAVNLSGCRSLRTLFGNSPSTTSRALKNCRELDLCSVNLLSKLHLAAALQAAVRLETLSLRYVATDQVLLGLSASSSSSSGRSCSSRSVTTLRLIDVAFSPLLTDKSVNVLVQNAPLLERLNLRGCREISAQCYNSVPVLLQRRGEGKNATGEAGATIVGGQKRRKGDNVFHFCDKG